MHLNVQAIIAAGLPLKERAPGLGGHLLQQIRLELEPLADVEIALFAGRRELEGILGPRAAPQPDFAVKGPGRGSLMPRHGLDVIDHVIGDGRTIDGRLGLHMESDWAAAPNIDRPGEAGESIETDNILVGAVSIEVHWSI